MTRDAMTGGGWALWTACTALFIALIAWLIRAGSRELDQLVAGHAREARLRRALTDHAATVGLILGWHDDPCPPPDDRLCTCRECVAGMWQRAEAEANQ